MSCHYLSKFISSINQACKKNSTYAVIDYNRLNLLLVKLIYRNGLLTHYFTKYYFNSKNHNKKVILIYFNYNDVNCSIRRIKQISKPGRRIYISNQKISNHFGKYNFSVISTSMGFFTFNEAKQLGIGGELLMEIEC